MRIWVWSSLILHLPSPTAQIVICVIIQRRVLLKSTVNTFPKHPSMINGILTYTLRGSWKSVMEQLRSNRVPTHKLPVSRQGQHRILENWRQVISSITNTDNPRSRKSHLVYPNMPYGALPATTLRITKCLTPDTIRSTYELCFLLWGYFLATYSTNTQLCKVRTGYIQLTRFSKS